MIGLADSMTSRHMESSRGMSSPSKPDVATWCWHRVLKQVDRGERHAGHLRGEVDQRVELAPRRPRRRTS